MQQQITFSQFVDAFREAGRYDQFGYDALKVLFDYLEQYEEDCDTDVKLDVIAMCCEFAVAHWQDIADDYLIDLDGCDDDDEKELAVLDYLSDNTLICGTCVDGIVYAQF